MIHPIRKTVISTTSRRINSRSAGFTLLEVMAALAILALAAVPILVSREQNVDRIRRSVIQREVSLLARQKLSEILSKQEELDSGDFSDAGHEEVQWTLQITDEKEILPPEDPNGTPLGSLTEIKLEVTYFLGSRQQSFELTTYRLIEPEVEEVPEDADS